MLRVAVSQYCGGRHRDEEHEDEEHGAMAAGGRSGLRCLGVSAALAAAVAALAVMLLDNAARDLAFLAGDIPATLRTNYVTLSSLAEFAVWVNASSVFSGASIGALLRGVNESEAAGADHLRGTYNLARHFGYPVENHTVRTEDGYLLTNYRLPRPGGVPVLLMHGVFMSSAEFVVMGPGRALALLLYDEGYDVWLVNARGNSESRRHETLNTSQAAFWDFSWHEIGERDLPALIDYILDVSGHTALHYVGHSQGTTTFFVLASERPEYMAKVKANIALAPVAFVRDMRSVPMRSLGIGLAYFAFIAERLGVFEVLPYDDATARVAYAMCGRGKATQPLCANIWFFIGGYGSPQIDEDIFPIILRNLPEGASVKQVQHWGQIGVRRYPLFRQFDHGPAENLRRYNSTTPPDYDLSRVTAATYFFFSDNDIISVPAHTDELRRKLPNVVLVRNVSAFNHADFLMGAQGKELVYDEVLDIFRQHDNDCDKNRKCDNMEEVLR